MTRGNIEVRGLSHSYGEVKAIERIDLAIAENELACIIGPSGCGKSTLLHIVSGLMPPTQGEVRVDGIDVYGGGPRPKVGYVFQEPRLLNWRTVEDNLRLALRATSIPPESWDQRIAEHLEMVGLSAYRKAWPLKLSGGQRQRVGIARALIVNPQYIIMDEPFSTLDEMTARAMRQELLEICEGHRKTILFVTHSISEAIFLADKIYFLTKGPAEKFKELAIPIPKPRDYEDPELYEMEARVVREVLDRWGLPELVRARGGR